MMKLNPEIAFIGAVSLIILFGHAAVAGRVAALRRVPAPCWRCCSRCPWVSISTWTTSTPSPSRTACSRWAPSSS
ncbi:hypothetical protein ACN28S_41270 [Cystobacter fuscus]